MNSYANSVPERESQENAKNSGRAPSYPELVHRLNLLTAGIDFLLGHPDLKSSDRELGIFMLRQTVLFGKETDKNTAWQQAYGVRNLNRGTGRHEKTLQRSRRRLHQAGFMRVFGEPGDWRGNTYAPDFNFISQEVEKMRHPGAKCSPFPGAKCSPKQSYSSSSNLQSASQLAIASEPERSEKRNPAQASALKLRSHPAPPWKDMPVPEDQFKEMQTHLIAISEAYPRANFGPASPETAHDILAAAKLSKPEATPNDVGAFLVSKFHEKRPYPYENGIHQAS